MMRARRSLSLLIIPLVSVAIVLSAKADDAAITMNEEEEITTPPVEQQQQNAAAAATSCIYSVIELQNAVCDYIDSRAKPNSIVAQTYGYPIGQWCLDTTLKQEDSDVILVIQDGMENITSITNIDDDHYNDEKLWNVSGWDRSTCHCLPPLEMEEKEELHDEIKKEETTSTPTRSASSSNSNSESATTTMTTLSTNTNSNQVSGTNGSSNGKVATTTAHTSASPTTSAEVPMLYRLMPLKLLACLLVITLIFAIRQLVDFHHYEGIDPSDQKTAEFELLQLAEQA